MELETLGAFLGGISVSLKTRQLYKQLTENDLIRLFDNKHQ